MFTVQVSICCFKHSQPSATTALTHIHRVHQNHNFTPLINVPPSYAAVQNHYADDYTTQTTKDVQPHQDQDSTSTAPLPRSLNRRSPISRPREPPATFHHQHRTDVNTSRQHRTSTTPISLFLNHPTSTTIARQRHPCSAFSSISSLASKPRMHLHPTPLIRVFKAIRVHFCLIFSPFMFIFNVFDG